MAITEAFSLSQECSDILNKQENKSKFVREAIKNYYRVEILPTINQVMTRLDSESGFETKLVEFINRTKRIIEGRH